MAPIQGLKVRTLVLRTLLARLVGLHHSRVRTAESLSQRDNATCNRTASPLVGRLFHWIAPRKRTVGPSARKHRVCLLPERLGGTTGFGPTYMISDATMVGESILSP